MTTKKPKKSKRTIEFLVGQFGAAETRKLLTEVIPDNASRGATA
jgi:hypothetical protein